MGVPTPISRTTCQSASKNPKMLCISSKYLSYLPFQCVFCAQRHVRGVLPARDIVCTHFRRLHNSFLNPKNEVLDSDLRFLDLVGNGMSSPFKLKIGQIFSGGLYFFPNPAIFLAGGFIFFPNPADFLSDFCTFFDHFLVDFPL